MIIELYGLPGSGKTTFAENLAKEGGFEIIKIRSGFELVFRNFLFFLRHPVRFCALFFYTARYAGGFRLFYCKFTNLFLHVNAKYQKAASRKKAVIDQGYFQNMLSLFENIANENVLKKYREFSLLPDRLVVFDFSEDILKERLKKRGYGSRENFSPEYRMKFEAAYRANHALLLRNLPEDNFFIRNGEESGALFQKLIQPFRRLYYVANSRIPTEKAHGFQIVRACEEFSRAGFEVELVIPSRQNPIAKNLFDFYGVSRNFTVRTIQMPDFIRFSKNIGSAAFWLQTFFFLRKLGNAPFDTSAIIYTRNPEVVRFFKKRRFFAVYEAHNWPGSKVALYRLLVRKADRIICNSTGTEKKFRAHGFLQTLVAPNGVDIEKFTVNEDREIVKKELGIPLRKKIVMYAGQFYKWKGVDTVFEAWEKHFSGREDAALVLVGGERRETTSGNIFFFGQQPHETIPRFLFCADILLLPNAPVTDESKFYTSPIKMFEYMASGRPIIASDLPSIREILNEKNALLFEAGNPSDLAQKIIFLAGNQKLAHEIAMKAYRDAQKYTWSNRAASIVAFIKKEISGKKHG
jgi:glycosyltransferase involved in cell wall biosynthesis